MKKILLPMLLIMLLAGMAMAADGVPVYVERTKPITQSSGHVDSWIPEGITKYTPFGGNGIMVTAGSKIRIPEADDEYEYYGMQFKDKSYWRQSNKNDYTTDFRAYMVPKKSGAFTPSVDEPVLLFRKAKSISEKTFWDSILIWWERSLSGGVDIFLNTKIEKGAAVLYKPKLKDGVYYIIPKEAKYKGYASLVPLSVHDFAFLLPPGANQFKLIDDKTCEITPIYDFAIPDSVKCEVTRDGQPASTKLKAGLTYQIKM